MGFLKSMIAVSLLMGLAAGQEEAIASNDSKTESESQRLSQPWRDLQLNILKSSHIFPLPDILNQRYGLVLKPVVIGHVLTTPSFHRFLGYYTKNLNPDSPLYEKAKENVKAALESTFDLLVKQYGHLGPNMDLWHDMHKRSVNELDFFLSNEFTDELLQKTSEYLQEFEDEKTSKIVKRAIQILETQLNLTDLLDGIKQNNREENVEDSLKVFSNLLQEQNPREISEADIEAYDKLSFPEKLAFLVEDELMDPFFNEVSYEMNRIKKAYNTDGIKGALKAIFSQGEHNVAKSEDDEMSKEAIIEP